MLPLSTCSFKPVSSLYILQAFPFPPLTTNTRYRVLYSDTMSDRNRVKLVNGTETTDVLTRLRFGQTYSVEMRPEYRYEYCTAYANGGYSQPVFATANETGCYAVLLCV